MRLDVVTVLPAYLEPLRLSLVGKAVDRGQVDLHVHDLRRWTYDVHRAVDDSPYGGGPGMVMKAQVWGEATDWVAEQHAGTPRWVVPTPSGVPFTQARAEELAREPWLAFAPARYEGTDDRVVADLRSRGPVDEISLGDYVLAGGDVAVLAVVEAVVRLLPGVLGNSLSAVEDSFGDGLLEGPVYTRPPVWRGLEVPAVLMGGDHGAARRWRREQSLERTARIRPDLLATAELTKDDKAFLARVIGTPPDVAE